MVSRMATVGKKILFRISVSDENYGKEENAFEVESTWISSNDKTHLEKNRRYHQISRALWWRRKIRSTSLFWKQWPQYYITKNRSVRVCFFVYIVISYFRLNNSVGSILNCSMFAVSLHQSHHFLCMVILPIFMLPLGEICIVQFP